MSNENDTQLRDAVTEEFTAAGYSPDHIEFIHARQEELKRGPEETHTWIRVHRKDLLQDTLVAYGLPWDWDEEDGNYLIIKEWIGEDFREKLFDHTKRLRDRKLVEIRNTMKDVKEYDRMMDNMAAKSAIMRGVWNRVSRTTGLKDDFVLPRDNAPQKTHIATVHQTFFSIEATAQDRPEPDGEERVLLGTKNIGSTGETQEAGLMQWMHISHEGVEFEAFLRRALEAVRAGKQEEEAVVSHFLNRILPFVEKPSFQGKRFLSSHSSTTIQLPGDSTKAKVNFITVPYFLLGTAFQRPKAHTSKVHWVQPLVQSAYHLDSSMSRENQQAIRRLHSDITEFLHVPQLWILTIGDKFIATCSPTPLFGDQRSCITTCALGRDQFPPTIRVTMSPGFVFCLKRDECTVWFEFLYRVYCVVEACVGIRVDYRRYMYTLQKDGRVIDGRQWPLILQSHNYSEPLCVLMSHRVPPSSEGLPATIPLEGKYEWDSPKDDPSKYLRADTEILDQKTLDEYRLPYYWDAPERGARKTLVVAQELTELDQKIIYDHTRRLRAMEDFSPLLDRAMDIEDPYYTPPVFVFDAAKSHAETKNVNPEINPETTSHQSMNGGVQDTSAVLTEKEKRPFFKWPVKKDVHDMEPLIDGVDPISSRAYKATTPRLNRRESASGHDPTPTQWLKALMAHMHYEILFNVDFHSAKKYNDLPLKTISDVEGELGSLYNHHQSNRHMLALARSFLRRLSRVLESFIGQDYDCIVKGKVWAAMHVLIQTFQPRFLDALFSFHCDIFSIQLRKIQDKIQGLRDGLSGTNSLYIPRSMTKVFIEIVLLLVDASDEATKLMQAAESSPHHNDANDDKSSETHSRAGEEYWGGKTSARSRERMDESSRSPSIGRGRASSVNRPEERYSSDSRSSEFRGRFRTRSREIRRGRRNNPNVTFFEKLSRRMDQIFKYLDDVQDECCLMFRSVDAVEDSASHGVDCGKIIALVMLSVFKGHSTCESLPMLDVEEIYRTYTSYLQLKARNVPSKSLLVDMNLLREELEIITKIVSSQSNMIDDLRMSSTTYQDYGSEYNDNISTSTTGSGRKISGIFSNDKTVNMSTRTILQQIQGELEERLVIFEELTNRVNRLEIQICQRVEIIEEDHGKAILVFSIVSTIFLPLSFVTSYLGMNTSDIRDMEPSQALFWEVAVPFTVAVVAAVLTVAYNINRIFPWISRGRALP
ncbi:hypothetical protein ETB97_002898 [Aspergillus alliaceus]|uniref:Uncharacterized protein n=1 Tax=Petromyces alliaceus TaxID=209559 RepID=A0A8H6A016_PETAA|nr:hypothetical protein ETB97_002898 [Aspergillus burnettii]